MDRRLENDAWERLLAVAKRSPSGKVLKSDLAKFLTSAEITLLEKRLAIPLLLAENLSYRRIGEILDVSSVTISFVKHNLTRKPRVHRKYSSLGKRKDDDDHSLFMSPREHMKRMRRSVGL